MSLPNLIIKIPIVLLFTLHITKNIAYHITEVLIFYADKLIVGNSKNLHVFNFLHVFNLVILLKLEKLRKFDAREIYILQKY